MDWGARLSGSSASAERLCCQYYDEITRVLLFLKKSMRLPNSREDTPRLTESDSSPTKLFFKLAPSLVTM